MAPAKSNPRQANGHRRRLLVARVRAEETHCAICGGPVDKTLTYDWGKHGPRCTGNCRGCVPHPMRAEVDEIIPVSLGGSPYERANCRLTHRECNRRRGNGTRTRRPTPTVTASDIW
jgi:5-methylcytosine-specific restriction endonuclease McrA